MGLPSFPIRDDDRERIEAVLSGAQRPVQPRPAATVALIRDGEAGLEVYLMRRARQMAFAPGMHVFPGGSVESADYMDVEPVSDEEALVRAAIRETFEECDVSLSPADLRPLAHWITPEIEPRRYDTHFFVAALPAGQECRDVGTEAEIRLWVPPQQAVDDGLTMMPPTAAVLADLARFADVASAMSAEREIVTVMPVFAIVGDRLELRI